MADYHRYFILPLEEYEAPIPEVDSVQRRPRYVGDPSEDRLDGYSSGGPFSRAAVENAGYDHLLAYNDGEEWRVVVAWGNGTEAWNALNEIHAFNHDTETLADHGEDVEPVMNERFGGGEWDIGAPPLNESENTA